MISVHQRRDSSEKVDITRFKRFNIAENMIMAVPIEQEVDVLSDSGILIKHYPDLHMQKKGGKKRNIFKILSGKLKGTFSCIRAYLRRNRIEVINSLRDTNEFMDVKVQRQDPHKNQSREGKVILNENNGFSCKLVVNAKTHYTIRFKTATDFCVYHLENGIYIKPGCQAEMESKQGDLSSWKSISLANSCESLNVNEFFYDDDSGDFISYNEDYGDTKPVSFYPFVSVDNDPSEAEESLYSAKTYQEPVESSRVEWLSDVSFYHHSCSELSCDVSHDNKDSGNYFDIHNNGTSFETYFMTEFHSNTSSPCDTFCSSLLSHKHIEVNEKEETDFNGIQNQKSHCAFCTDDMLCFIKVPDTATENVNDPKRDNFNYLDTNDGFISTTFVEHFGDSRHISIFHRCAFYLKIVVYFVESVSMAKSVAFYNQNLFLTDTSCLDISCVTSESHKLTTHKYSYNHCMFISNVQCREENGYTCYLTGLPLRSDSPCYIDVPVVLNFSDDNAVVQILLRALCSESLARYRFNGNFCFLISLYDNMGNSVNWECKLPCNYPSYLLTIINLLEVLQCIGMEWLIKNITEGQEKDTNNTMEYLGQLFKDSTCRPFLNNKLFRQRALTCYNLLTMLSNDLNLYNRHRTHNCYNLMNIFFNGLNLCNGHDTVISRGDRLFHYKCLKCCMSALSKTVKACDSSDKKNCVRDNSPSKKESYDLRLHSEIENKQLSGSIYKTSSPNCKQTVDVLLRNGKCSFCTSIRECIRSPSYISTRVTEYSSSSNTKPVNSTQSPHCFSFSNNEANDSLTFSRASDLYSIVSKIQTQNPSPSTDADVSSTNNKTESQMDISTNNKTHRSETNHDQQPTFTEHDNIEDSLNINDILSYSQVRQRSFQYTSNLKDHVSLYFKMVKNSDTNRFARRVTLDKFKQIQLKMDITKYFKEANLDARGDLKKLNDLPLLEMLSKILGMPKSSSFFNQHFKIPEEFRIISVHPLQKGDVNAPQGLDQFFERVLEGDENEIETRMRIEWFRVITFQTYPSITGISTLQLARHGFYYTGHMTETRCYFCRQTYREWDEGSDIAAIHRQISPDCSFLNGRETDNEPIHSQSSNSFHITADPGSTSSTFSHEGIDSPGPAQSTSSNSADQSQPASLPLTPLATAGLPITASASLLQTQLSTAGLPTTTASTTQNNFSPQSSKSKSKKEKRRKRKEALARTEGNPVPPAASSPTDAGLVEHEGDQLQDAETNEPPASSLPALSESNTSVSKSSTRSNTSTSSSGSSTSEPRKNPPLPGGLVMEEVHHHSSEGAVSNQATAAASPVVRDPNPTSSQSQGASAPSSKSSNSAATILSSAPPARQAERSGANPPGATSAERLSQLDPLGINFDKPKYPAYAVLQTRINSYQGWPSHMTQTPTEMSRAGFFYAGYGDYARCFFCGGGLRNWDRNDDPWIEHARWFPRCAFLRNNKGDKYVARIQRRHQEQEAGLRPLHQLPPPIEQDMDTVQAQTLREMGYKNNDIQQAMNEWRNRLRPGRRMPPPMTAAALMDILLDMEEKANQEQRSGTDIDSQIHLTFPDNRADESVNERLPQGNGYDDKERHEIQVLQEEFTGLKETLLCKICCDKDVAAAFLPCGHLVCCLDCAPAMRRCPVCDEIIKGTVKTYFS